MAAVLVVGAGAVGQVFGRHLQRGGAQVTVLVRERHRAEAEAGFTLYPLNGRRAKARFEGFGVATDAGALKGGGFDQVYLTVSSAGLQGPWLAALARVAGDATWVMLQPNPADRETLLAAGVDAARLVEGMIGFLSYAAPLPGETRFPEPGMAYWFPPFSPSGFDGPKERVAAVVAALRAGGLPARAQRAAQAHFTTAALVPLMGALEAAGWSLKALVSGQWLAVGTGAGRQAQAVFARSLGRRPLVASLATSPLLVRLGLGLAPAAVPVPLEAYLQRHFTKVGAQTRLYLVQIAERGHALGVEVGAVERLLGALGSPQEVSTNGVRQAHPER